MSLIENDLIEDLKSLINTLSLIPTQQLVILITQHSNLLPKYFSKALELFAKSSIEKCNINNEFQEYSIKIANILRRLISRGDPSQAKKLIGNTKNLIDLILCVDCNDIISRLIDRNESQEILKVMKMTFEKVLNSNSTSIITLNRTSFIFSRISNAMPRFLISSKKSQQQIKLLNAELNDSIKLLTLINENYNQIEIETSNLNLTNLQSKSILLDLSWSIIDRLYCSNQLLQKDSDKLMNAIGLRGIQRISSKDIPLINFPLILDISYVFPFIELVQKNDQVVSNDLIEKTKQIINRNDFGRAWKKLIENESRIENKIDNSKSTTIDSDLLTTIFAILPNWQERQMELEEKLSMMISTGQSNDDIIAQLLDEQEKDEKLVDSSNNDKNDDDIMNYVSQRANIFDNDERFSNSNLLSKRKGKERLQDNLSEDLKRLIIERTEANDLLDEEENQEWNPFMNLSNVKEFGFEEELDEEENERNVDVFDYLQPTKPNENEFIDENDNDDIEIDNQSNIQNNIQNNNQIETFLITAWKRKGKELFLKDSRKSKTRIEILNEINNNLLTKNATKWDDQLIESWGKMFERNPKKEKLLFSVDDILRIGNTNHFNNQNEKEDQVEEQDRDSSFGPNRGKGGRILEGNNSNTNRGNRGRGSNRNNRSRGSNRSRGRARSGGLP